MNPIINRVALAIERTPYDGDLMTIREAQARSAVAAMRDLTPELAFFQDHPGARAFLDGWHAMIDHILEDAS